MFGSQPQLKVNLQKSQGQASTTNRGNFGQTPYKGQNTPSLGQNQMNSSFNGQLNNFSKRDKQGNVNINSEGTRAKSSLGIQSNKNGILDFPNLVNTQFNEIRLSQNIRAENQSAFPGIHQNAGYSSSLGINSQNPFAHDLFTSNPTILLHQHNQCKVNNKERLKDVKNLEDLINFKVTTIADQIKDQKDIFNQDHILSQRGLNASSIVQLQTETSINALKKMCDPLLANRQYPQLLSKNKLGYEQDDDESKKYEIPKSWLQPKTQYNKLTRNQKQDSKSQKQPKVTKKESDLGIGDEKKAELDRPESSESYIRNRDKFLSDQEALKIQSDQMKQEHTNSLKQQEERLIKSRADRQIDPIKMLKGFFESKEQQKLINQGRDQSKSEMSHLESMESIQNH